MSACTRLPVLHHVTPQAGTGGSVTLEGRCLRIQTTSVGTSEKTTQRMTMGLPPDGAVAASCLGRPYVLNPALSAPELSPVVCYVRCGRGEGGAGAGARAAALT